jgi:hypothetical protein
MSEDNQIIKFNPETFILGSGKPKKRIHFVVLGVLSLIAIGFVYLFDISPIPFGFFQFWHTNVNVWEGIKKSWPAFAWGLASTLLILLVIAPYFKRSTAIKGKLSFALIEGFLTSVLAGVLEEIFFRWLIFYGAMIWLKVFNIVLIGLTWLFYTKIFMHTANFFTFGLLNEFIFFPGNWIVGAAMISANGSFRNRHDYLSGLGYVNSWFIGMFMFGIMFRYGLLTAIIVHFLYDLVIFTTAAFIRYRRTPPAP